MQEISLEPFIEKVHEQKQNGVCYAEIANELGYSATYLSKILKGRQKNLDFNFLAAACHYFQCGILEIINFNNKAIQAKPCKGATKNA